MDHLTSERREKIVKIVLLIILAGIIAATGYYTYQARQVAERAFDASSRTAKTP